MNSLIASTSSADQGQLGGEFVAHSILGMEASDLAACFEMVGELI